MPAEHHQPAATMRHRLPLYFNVDQAMPEVVRRPMRWNMAGVLVVGLPLAATLALVFVGVVSGLAWLLMPPAAMFFALWVGHWIRISENLVDRAAAHDHRLCPNCLYDLRTLDATGTCPECGSPYEHAAVRAQWLDAERRLKRT